MKGKANMVLCIIGLLLLLLCNQSQGLRSGCFTEKDRFDHLYPISFEMWHTAMNFLKLIFKHLYNEKGFDKGSMNAEIIRLSRKFVKPDVQNNYDHDKDFFLSFLNAYIVEALCEFFGLETLIDNPTKNTPPVHGSEDERKVWQQQIFDTFINKCVWAKDTDASVFSEQETTEISITPLHLQMPDGSISVIKVPKINKKKCSHASHDRVKHYGHSVLQLGLLYKQFLDVIDIPDRNRLMVTMKYMMAIFKASNNRSKYALEIMRFLCHQQSTYSLKTAYQSTHGLFVNTGGKVNSNIPADLQMEHIVRKVKKLIKASGPNNMEGSVKKKTIALSGISNIADMFDVNSGVVVRANTHKRKSSHADEVRIMEDLRVIRPFSAKTGRAFDKFESIEAPVQVERQYFESWIHQHKYNLTFETGK